MCIALLEVKLNAPWVHSLKEKRSVVKPLLAKLRATFNVSAAETDEADTHQTIVIAVAAIAAHNAQAHSMLENILHCVEENTDATVMDVRREIL